MLQLVRTTLGNYIIREDPGYGSREDAGLPQPRVLYNSGNPHLLADALEHLITLKKGGISRHDVTKFSPLVQSEAKKLAPKKTLQHRKVFMDDGVQSVHTTWHQVGDRDIECSHTEAEARAVIENAGGIEKRGYCINLYREVAA